MVFSHAAKVWYAFPNTEVNRSKVMTLTQEMARVKVNVKGSLTV